MNILDVVKYDLCIGCGLCSVDDNVIDMVYNKNNDCLIPVVKFNGDHSLADEICPGKGYDIIEMAKSNISAYNKYDLELGFYINFVAARMFNKEILDNASSGGTITGVLIYLLESKIVDKVSVTKFISCEDGIKTKTFLTNDITDILEAQGSKYCPVNYNELLNELRTYDGNVAVVGTPCVIAGVKAILNVDKTTSRLKSNIVITLANFCGGFKSTNNIRKLAKIHNIEFSDIDQFRFRGGGQPGSLRIVSKKGIVVETPYPNYVGLTGQSKMLRCHLCVDATGELADLSFGDAWIPRFEKDNFAWSVIVSRTAIGDSVLDEMLKMGKMCSDVISVDELKYSQRFNLNSKKKRQFSRMKLYKFLGYKIPVFDGGFYLDKYDLKLEVKIYLKHKFKNVLEKLHLYFIIFGKSKLK